MNKYASVLLALVLIPAAYTYYVVPSAYQQEYQVQVPSDAAYDSYVNQLVLQRLQALQQLQHQRPISMNKRCAVNTLDESCSAGSVNNAGRDSEYLSGGKTPGRR